MTDLRIAAQQALEAMEAMQSYAAAERKGLRICDEAIPALRAALAEPVQEPVAWMIYTLDGKSVCVTDNPADFTEQHKALPLYTAPPQRKPLTDEDAAALIGMEPRMLKEFGTEASGAAMELIRRTERAHGIGGQE